MFPKVSLSAASLISFQAQIVKASIDYSGMYILFSVFKTTARIDADWFRTCFILRDQNLKEASLDKGFSQIQF